MISFHAKVCLLAAAAAISISPSSAFFQAAPKAPPPGPIENNIIVSGRTSKQLKQLVETLTPVSHGHQIGRWHQQICVQIVGLDLLHSDIIKNQVVKEGKTLGLRFDEKLNCIANISIAIATNADEIAAAIPKKASWLITDPKEGDPPRYLETALVTPQPVRWFVANRTLSAEGLSGFPSRIRKQSREETVYAYILVDANKLTGITWRQLANYVTFVALAGPAPGRISASDSILSIFDDRDKEQPGPTTLTTMDQSFLKALYNVDPQLPPETARSSIEGSMRADQGRAAP